METNWTNLQISLENELFRAAANGDMHCVKRLIDRGVNINAQDKLEIMRHKTALHAASWNGHFVVVKLLLDVGANINIRDQDGMTALMTAAIKGYKDIVTLLLQRGAEIDLVDNSNETALFYGCYWGKEDVVELLLEYGADLEIVNQFGASCLHSACAEGHLYIADLLLERNIDMNRLNMNGDSALHLACINGNNSVVELLLNYGVDVEAANADGKRALQLACYLGHKNIVSMLLEHCVDIEAVDNLGHNALHAACSSNNVDIVVLLVQKGISTTLEDKNKKTPIELCVDVVYQAVFKAIFSALAGCPSCSRCSQLENRINELENALQLASVETAEINQVLLDTTAHKNRLLQENERLLAELEEMQQRLGLQARYPFQQYRHHELSPGILSRSQMRTPGLHDVPSSSPLFTFCRDECNVSGSWAFGTNAVGGFRLVAVQAIVHDENEYTLYTTTQARMSRLRQTGGDYFNFASKSFSQQQLHVLSMLRDRFQEQAPGSGNRSVNTLYCYHGPKREHVASICKNGLVATSALDSGYFGHGCYSTLNIEYAAKYARGDFDGAGRRYSPDGRYPVIMFAASVGMAYPVTPDVDYGNGSGTSDFFGKPLKSGFDCHVICVNQANGFQAVDRASCQYVELVIAQQAQLLPIAVLWFA